MAESEVVKKYNDHEKKLLVEIDKLKDRVGEARKRFEETLDDPWPHVWTMEDYYRQVKQKNEDLKKV